MPLDPASPLGRLLNAPLRPGVLDWIGLRPAHRAPMLTPAEAMLQLGEGVVGDRWRGKGKGTRQVTLMGAEDLEAIASFLGRAQIEPERLRRNLIVRGINWRAFKDHHFRVGEAVLEMTGEAHPCSRMEETLGPGGFNAVRGHGGITARVVQPGLVRIGDAVTRVD